MKITFSFLKIILLILLSAITSNFFLTFASASEVQDIEPTENQIEGIGEPLQFSAETGVHKKSKEAIDEHPKPTWETQKQARTFQLCIPAPRGEITDRNGEPLAQSKVSYNLALQFPTPLELSDQKAVAFAKQQITFAQGLLHHLINISDKAILSHYHHRGLLPLDLIEDLSPSELAKARHGLTSNLMVRETCIRFYPQRDLAPHLIGYTGREAPLSTRPIENKDLIFPEIEGREGIEQVFNTQLKGHPGDLFITYDQEGKKSSERISKKPIQGDNVITTIDANLQRLCEKALQENCKKGALVFLDPNTGEILAMASCPGYNLNDFVPTVDPKIYEQLSKNPDVPLLPRSFRSAYPAGSAFKTVVGVAALESGKISPTDTFPCPPTFNVGNVTFHNWKKTDAGHLNFVQALTQSCNTWFYQCALKIGAEEIIDWSRRLGLGRGTGIPLKGEAKGNIPDDTYMLRVHHRKILPGDTANMSIGQGDILITPLQMAQAMGVIASGGKFHQTRLIQQIQTADNKVTAAYSDRIRTDLKIKPEILETLREGLINVTEDSHGTAHRAQVKGIHVAGKSGTAQWGPSHHQRTAAWFTGFAPADHPQYAFAALYEGEPGDNSVHGGSHAAPMIKKVLEGVYGNLKASPSTQEKTSPTTKDDDDQSN